jgi:hypothetical protein
VSFVKRRRLEVTAIAFAAGVMVAASWFWTRQVFEVIELLRLAYG